MSCAWQLLVWISLHPGLRADTEFGTLDGVEDAYRLASSEQLAQTLRFSSSNQWILEEVAIWLALQAGWTVCHYYSGNQNSITEWFEGSFASTH